MKTLFINACVRDGSRTLRLAKRLICRLGEYEEINLEARGIFTVSARQNLSLPRGLTFGAPMSRAF